MDGSSFNIILLVEFGASIGVFDQLILKEFNCTVVTYEIYSYKQVIDGVCYSAYQIELLIAIYVIIVATTSLLIVNHAAFIVICAFSAPSNTTELFSFYLTMNNTLLRIFSWGVVIQYLRS